MFGVKEGSVKFQGTEMDYVSFGKGAVPLVIIPGLGDGLRTVKGVGLTLAWSFRRFAKDFRVWCFSRKNILEPGTTTRDMARDLVQAMDELGIDKANVMGVSQGGMIAQWLAIDYPQRVDKLVIGISTAYANETVQEVVGNWVNLATQGRYAELTIDSLEKNFTQQYLKKYKPFYWLIKRMTKPSSKERFIIQAQSCLSHDALDQLGKIQSQTLVIGGGADLVVGDESVQRELADAIPNSKIIVYPEYGHGVYEESKDFNVQVYDFLK